MDDEGILDCCTELLGKATLLELAIEGVRVQIAEVSLSPEDLYSLVELSREVRRLADETRAYVRQGMRPERDGTNGRKSRPVPKTPLAARGL